MRPAEAIALGLALVALGGCGDDGSPQGTGARPASTEAKRLEPSEQKLVSRSNRIVQRYCGRLALSLTGQRAPPSGEERVQALAATERVIDLAREKPAARLGTGVDMALFLGDLAEDLEGSNCDRRLVGRLDQALATLPRP